MLNTKSQEAGLYWKERRSGAVHNAPSAFWIYIFILVIRKAVVSAECSIAKSTNSTPRLTEISDLWGLLEVDNIDPINSRLVPLSFTTVGVYRLDEETWDRVLLHIRDVPFSSWGSDINGSCDDDDSRRARSLYTWWHDMEAIVVGESELCIVDPKVGNFIR